MKTCPMGHETLFPNRCPICKTFRPKHTTASRRERAQQAQRKPRKLQVCPQGHFTMTASWCRTCHAKALRGAKKGTP